MLFYMKFLLFLLLPFIIIQNNCLAQKAEEPSFKLFLIGDAGEGDTTGATLRDLKVMLHNSPNSAVVFLGDNCYLKSFIFMPVETGGYNGSKTAKRRIMSQLNILKGYKGSAFFVP